MRRTSTVFVLFVSTLAIAALMTTSALPAPAQTLEWLNSPVKVPARVTGSPDDHVLTALKGNVHPLATAKYDQGLVSDSLPMEHIIMSLQRSPEQAQMLTAVIDGQKNRHSELYHHWLTPVQFGSHFGPASSDIAAVTSWLQSHGFRVDQVTAGRTAIIFSGTAGQVRAAFHTEIHNLNVNGAKHIANMTEPMIPTALAPVVRGFRSLNNFFPGPTVGEVGKAKRDKTTGKVTEVSGLPSAVQAGRAKGGPHSNASDGFGDYMVGPQDFYTIYNENPLLAAGINGAGTTIAVVEGSDVNPADVTTFRSQFALPAYPTPPNNTQGGVNYLFGADGVVCTDPGIVGAGLEGGLETVADIDVQWAGTTAPNATIDFVSCASSSTTAGVDLSAMYVVNALASTVSAFSDSFGTCEALSTSTVAAFYNDLWEQAAAQGQTVVVAAGGANNATGWNSTGEGGQENPSDSAGSTGCDAGAAYATNPVSTNVLASSQYDVATGATDFSDTYQTEDFTLAPNTWWNTTASTSANGYESALSYVPEITFGGRCSSPIFVSYNLFAGFGLGNTPEQICNLFNSDGEAVYTTPIGGAGGVSIYNNIPTWQAVYGVGQLSDGSNNGSSTAFRNLPDISLFGSNFWWNHANIFCQSDLGTCNYAGVDFADSFLIAGGTGFSAPEMAGIMGLVVQQTGANQGPANYNIYGLAAQEYGVPGAPNTTMLTNCSGSAWTTSNTAFSSCLFQDIAGDTPCLAGSYCNADGVTITSDIQEACATGGPNCYTATAGDALGESSLSTTSFVDAYPVSQGYDVATGLGSLNINNLVTQWESLSTLWPTDTSLTANPTTISGSETTALAATVVATGRGGFVAPVGSVTYYLGSIGGTNIGSALLSPACTGTAPNYSCSGTATLNAGTDLFQLGANNVYAYFPGDGANDAASSSGPVVVTVTQLATATAVTSSMNPAVYGQPVTFTATITPVSTPAPTGTVEFQSNGVDISGCSAVTVAAGTAQCLTGGATLTNGLPVGTNSIVAIYSGDSNYTGSTSPAFSQVITPAVLTVTANPATMTYGGTIPAFSATITGFVNGDTLSVVSGTASLVVNCQAGMLRKQGVTPQPTCLFPVGSYPIVASQGTLAAANYTFTFVNGTLTVTQDTTTTAVTSSLNPSVFGQAVTFTGLVTPAASVNGATPTGTVEYQSNGTDIPGCSAVTVAYGGVTTCTTTALAVGTNSITAIYSGDSNYLGSTSTPLSQVVNMPVSTLIPTAIAFSAASPNPATVGQTVTFTAAVGPSLTVAPTGTVEFQANGTDISGCSAVPLATVAPGVIPTASCSTSTLAVGMDAIVAIYSGDTNYSTSTSPALTETVNAPTLIPTGTAFTAATPNPAVVGQTVTFTAAVSPSLSVPPTGTVTFLANGAAISDCPTGITLTGGSPGVSPTATCTTTALTAAAGTYAITAVYSGDSNYATSTSPALSEYVVTATTPVTTVTIITSASPNPAVAGQTGPVVFTAMVGPIPNGVPAPTGTVTFYANATAISDCTPAAPSSTGVATCSTLTLTATATTWTITATYSGDSNYSGSTSAAITETVSPVTVVLTPTSTAFTVATPNPAGVGQTVTFTAAVSPSLASAPTGTITFLANGAAISDCPAETLPSVAPGVIPTATCNTTTLTAAAGSYAITAVYSGDSNYATSTSAALTEVVNAVSVILTPTGTAFTAASPNPATVGQTVTFTAAVGPSLTTVAPTGTVTFTANGSAISDCPAETLATVAPGIVPTATCNTKALTAATGSYLITATYSGDSNYSGSTSPTLTEVVNNAVTVSGTISLSTSEPVLGVKAGDTVTAPVAVTFTGTITAVNLTCSVVPAGPTCSVSPTAVTSSGASATVTITTTSSNASLHRSGGAWMFALMLPGLLLIPGSRTVRRRAMWLLGGVLLLLTLSVAGCGSANTSALYQVTVTGTDAAASGATGSTAIAVQVHK